MELGKRKADRADIDRFIYSLIENERSRATIEKYQRDIRCFFCFLEGEPELDKQRVLMWKEHLLEHGYAVRSINSMIAAVNSFFGFLGWSELKIKQLRFQRQPFRQQDRELTREEYFRLISGAKQLQRRRLSLTIQAICSTGIRVSELAFITVEAVQKGYATVSLKGKTRTVFLPKALCTKLRHYSRDKRIYHGSIFITKKRKPLSRHQIWAEMKQLCRIARVKPSKVFPHNLRHLFAQSYYQVDKDLAKLADLLGHSSIETTRIYVASSGKAHERQISLMRLVE